MQIAFYAPLKSPDHPNPSGDRLMASLLVRALEENGHEVTLISRLRSYQRNPNDTAIETAARQEASSLLAKYEQPGAARPDLWFTYHPYYRALDYLGPTISRALNIPYVTAEASYSPKHDQDEWAFAQTALKEALRMGALHFCFTPIDLAGLAQVVPRDKLVELPPFIDVAKFQPAAMKLVNTPRRLITVAMMRAGVKIDSYAMLAQALAKLPELDWHLDIVGDGRERGQVEALFADIPEQRLTWHGELSSQAISELLRRSDIYLWPGYGEAYGLAYLEAQASGLPVIAQDTKGVPFVVEHGITGLLTPLGDVEDYAEAIQRLCKDVVLCQEMSKNAADIVHQQRSLKQAAAIIEAGLSRLVE